MNKCLITTVSMTLAMKGKGILEQNGIAATVSRLPPNLTASGCAWGIAIDCSRAKRAKEVLEVSSFAYGKMVYSDGSSVLSKHTESTPPGITGMPHTTVSSKGGKSK